MSAKRFTGKTESDAVMNAAMELGVGSCGSEAAFFYIFFTANGKFKKMRVRFTEKRYKEFLAFVPEGKETDPMTSDYQIRWRSAMRSYGKSRDDFDEW